MSRSLDHSAYSVVGAGRSGVAAANALARRGANVLLLEARPEATRPAALVSEVAFRPGTNDVRAGDVAVLSPGIAEVSPVRAAVAARASEVIGEVELFYRLCPAPILAITGTDGKSTTTTMLGAIAEAAGARVFVGGNLGNPLCEGLDDLTADHLVIAEISAFQLTTCRDFRPRVAIVTNIAVDHTDYHGSFAAYRAAKRRIWQAMTADDTLILNADDPTITGWELPEGPRVAWFSLTSPSTDAFLDAETLRVREGGEAAPLMPREALPVLGAHNVSNALAAALAASRWGLPLTAARAALSAYEPLPHRLAPVETVRGVRWIDDSKATSPNAASAALRAVDGPTIWLGGGSDKGADFTALAALVRERCRVAVVFGQTRHAIRDTLVGAPEVEVVAVEALEDAVATADRLATPGDTVLLSPACASFDAFDSYAHRGRVFSELVRALGR